MLLRILKIKHMFDKVCLTDKIRLEFSKTFLAE
jgi:hypothetical protein